MELNILHVKETEINHAIEDICKSWTRNLPSLSKRPSFNLFRKYNTGANQEIVRKV